MRTQIQLVKGLGGVSWGWAQEPLGVLPAFPLSQEENSLHTFLLVENDERVWG